MDGVKKEEVKPETESEDSLSNFEGFVLILGAFFVVMSISALVGYGVAELVSLQKVLIFYPHANWIRISNVAKSLGRAGGRPRQATPKEIQAEGPPISLPLSGVALFLLNEYNSHKYMRKTHTTLLGKTVRHISRLRGGGSALPGLVVEKIDKDFLSHTLSQLPLGVVVISGTNGKTTTTKMVTELLKSQGLNVFTNPTGSNFKRGVISALLDKVDKKGKLHADIAVLELDEAHAVHFVREVPPTYSLLLNVMRDQLDRFGEIDKTTEMLATIARATKKGVVLNREDPQILEIGKQLPDVEVSYFGLEPDLRHFFPSDEELRGEVKKPIISLGADVIVKKFSSGEVTFLLGKKPVSTHLNITGIYNVLNAAAALSLVRKIIGSKVNETTLMSTLAGIKPAFGRGEKMVIHGQELELVLVKNPSGFRLGLKSFSAKNIATMIAINDNYADGRDMSWLWDVDFESLSETGVRMVSGVRAYDMALRLQYDEVKFDYVDTDLKKALDTFINETGRPKRIFCTYTAMLTLRKELTKYADLERVL